MNKVESAVLLALALLLCPSLPSAAETLPFAVQRKVMELRQAGPPERIDSRLIFTYVPEGRAAARVRLVGARFAHEDWTVLHPYSRNPNGVFVLLIDLDALPPGLRELRYRIVEDGLWMADPGNPSRAVDMLGTEFSLARVEGPLPARGDGPAVAVPGEVTLQLRERPGRRVTVSGTFNGWDPFLYPLKEEEPGRYRVRLRLTPGTYYYHFWVDGERRTDPANPLTSYGPEGDPVSRLVVPEETRSSILPATGRPASEVSLYRAPGL